MVHVPWLRGDRAVAFADRSRVVAFADRCRAVVLDGRGFVVIDRPGEIVEDRDLHVLLGVHVERLGLRLVLEADFIEALPPFDELLLIVLFVCSSVSV
jgi:hypothetical protein